MGLKNCEILFDNSFKTYYAGQTITGRVVLTLDSSKNVRGIKVKFSGEASTHFVRSEDRTDSDGKSKSTSVDYTGHEEYFNIMFYVLGRQIQNEAITLPIGVHTYPFTCVLPPTLPSSFEGEHGYVRYTVKVTLDRPWKFDQDMKVAFTVLSPVDLNQFGQRVKEPMRVELEKYFCCCWCRSGPLTVVVSVPYTGYVPGQRIPLGIEVDNVSNVEVSSVVIRLRKCVTFYSQSPTRDTQKSEIIIHEIRVGPVAGRDTTTYNETLQVPSLPPSNLTNCGIIDLDYELGVEAVVTGFHTNSTGKIPVVIGTIPLTGMPYTQPVTGAQPVTSLGWTFDQANHSGNMSPPSFEQSQFGTMSIQDKNDNEHTRFLNGSREYSPMYPVYNFNYAPSAPSMQ